MLRLRHFFTFRPLQAAGVAIAFAGCVLHPARALPTTSVIWGNFVGDETPVDSALRDDNGITLLTSGSTTNSDGAVLMLGYFTGATTAASFSGDFVPLSGPWSNNVPHRGTTIGDTDTDASGALGFFSIQTDFDQGNAAIFQDIPAVGTRLCVLVFNAANLTDATHFNIATNDTWRWKAPALVPNFVTINLNDAGTTWFGGAGSERRTAVPIAEFPTATPLIFAPPQSIAAVTGETINLRVTAAGAGPLAYQWFKDGTTIAGATTASYSIPSFSASATGDYQVLVSNSSGDATSEIAVVSSGSPRARLVNLSTRGFVGTGGARMIGGFYIGGTGMKTVLIRATGPTLGIDPFNVPGVLADPVLTLYRMPNGQELAANDNWGEQPNAAEINAAFTATGAFPWPTDSTDAAMLLTLPANAGYTAHVTGANDTTGVALLEVYVVDDAEEPNARLVNISTRGLVRTGADVLIPGLYAGSGGARRLLIRAAGPSLGADPINLAEVLSNPKIEVYFVGQSTPVATNDNWEDGGLGSAVAAAAQQVYAFPFTQGSHDAALILDIPAKHSATGLTVVVSGANGETGIALAEVYELPAQ